MLENIFVSIKPILKDSPGLPGKSSLQRQEQPRRYTGTWVDQVQVSDVPQWGRPRFNKMGHRIKLKVHTTVTNNFFTLICLKIRIHFRNFTKILFI